MDGDIGIGGDGMSLDSEEVLGVWRDCFWGDGFYVPVPAGYGGPDPDRGRGGTQDGVRPGVRVQFLPFWFCQSPGQIRLSFQIKNPPNQ